MSTRQWNPRTDNAGRIPVEGDYVAYNYSGELAAGFITKIGKTNTGRPLFHIVQVLPTEGHKSIVRGGPRCVLVLTDENSAPDVRPLNP